MTASCTVSLKEIKSIFQWAEKKSKKRNDEHSTLVFCCLTPAPGLYLVARSNRCIFTVCLGPCWIVCVLTRIQASVWTYLWVNACVPTVCVWWMVGSLLSDPAYSSGDCTTLYNLIWCQRGFNVQTHCCFFSDRKLPPLPELVLNGRLPQIPGQDMKRVLWMSRGSFERKTKANDLDYRL